MRILMLIQCLSVFLFSYSILTIGLWMENSYSIHEISKSFEETDMFFQDIDEIISQKIDGQRNRELFENPNGTLASDKSIDIQSFGKIRNTVQDMNTTYLLSDLVNYAKSGGLQKLHDAIIDARKRQEGGTELAGTILNEMSGELETILPVTGISISECSKWYSNPADFILKTYELLDEVCTVIYEKYEQYTTEQDETWKAEAPSNLRYYIESTVSGERFTNIEATDLETAVTKILSQERYQSIYESERKLGLIVTNSDNISSSAAARRLGKTIFSDTSEKVFIAVDRNYEIGDVLKIDRAHFSKRDDTVRACFVIAIASMIVCAGSFLVTLIIRKRKYNKKEIVSFDNVPMELTAAIYVIALVLLYILFWRHIPLPTKLNRVHRGLTSLGVVVTYVLIVSAVFTFIGRLRRKTLWKNSISSSLIKTWKEVNSSRVASGQVLLYFIVIMVFNFVFMLFGNLGIFLMIILDMVVLLYLLQDMTGKQSIYEGLRQISKGDLKYKINTSSLQGESYEMARAVNDMGDGLQEAVDAIIKNERLKAELITNVSHDIKTPLTSIVNYVDLLKRENIQNERVQQYLSVLEAKSQRLKQLTEDLVEASKISSGNVELEMMKVNLQSMLQQAYGEFQDRFEERKLLTVWEIDKDPVYIMADGRQLWRIMENLLGNIYKYAMDGTRLYIELHRTDRMVSMSFTNTSKEEIHVTGEELIHRFVRGDQSRNTEGSGLGLSIAHSLTELMDGQFSVNVQGDEYKATVVFPVVADADEI